MHSFTQTTTNQVNNLGVILETDLSFSSHVTKSAYYHLKNIARIICFVSSQDLEKRVHGLSPAGWIIVMISSQRRALDRCSSSRTLILTRNRTSEHITPVLRSLHWLTFTSTVHILIYKALNGLGAKYMQICSLNINLTEHSDQ